MANLAQQRRWTAFLLGTVGLFVAGGCVKAGVGIEYTTGGSARYLVDNVDHLVLHIARPTICGELGDNGESHWAAYLQTELERCFKNAARENGTRITCVALDEDLEELLRQRDLRAAGYVTPAANAPAAFPDCDVLLRGELRISVSERAEPRCVVNPMGALQYVPYAGGFLGGGSITETVMVPVRETSVSATMKLITNDGTREAPLSIAVPSRVTEGGYGHVRTPGESADGLTPRDDDIQALLSEVAPAFVRQFYPESARANVWVEACHDSLCRQAVKMLQAEALSDNPDMAQVIACIKSHLAVHPDCPKAQFALAVAYELSGDLDRALGIVRRAIQLDGKLCKQMHSNRSKDRTAAHRHPYIDTQARLIERINYLRNEDAVRKLREQRQQPPGRLDERGSEVELAVQGSHP